MNYYIYIIILVFCCSCRSSYKVTHRDDSITTVRENSIKEDTFKYFNILESNFTQYQLPDKFKKPKKWRIADKERLSSISDYRIAYPDSFQLSDVLSIIDTACEFYQVRMAYSWCIKNYQVVFPYLVMRLGDKRKIGLKNSADLIIWERIETGDLEFYGHGGGIQEDLFTVAGRASWILNNLTGENFAVVHGWMTIEEATHFKVLWKGYKNKLK